MKAKEYLCTVCHTPYAASAGHCPRCGCRRGENVPAFLRCKNCRTIFAAHRKACPGCGQKNTPQNATGVFLPTGYDYRCRQQRRRYLIAAVIVAAVAVGEIFVVSRLYQQETYRESLQLWNTPENIDANRRSPDPVYEEPAAPEVPDSLFTIDGATHHAEKQDADADMETDTLFTD
jgi:hypothetical protein